MTQKNINLQNIKSTIVNIVKTINSRNWRNNNSNIQPIYDDIIALTLFLPQSSKLNERFYCILHDIKAPVLCRHCHINPVRYTNNLNGYKQFCSLKCATNDNQTKIKTKQTYLKKYGVNHPNQLNITKQKAKLTCLQKYGVEHATQSKQFKEQSQKTCLQKYGVEHITQSKQFKEQSQKTCLQKYGTNNYNQSLSFKQKNQKIIEQRQNTKIINYYYNTINRLSCIPLFTIQEYINTHQEYEWQCKICHTKFKAFLKDGQRPICPKCFPKIKSKPEKALTEFIIKNNLICQENKRNILDNKFELDVYLPTKNLGIEYHGLFWHSELGGNKNKNYHISKLNLCQKKNIRLIQIFEDEWIRTPKIVIARLKNILHLIKYKIYARKCIIKEIDKQMKNKFLNKYHIQGSDKSSIHLGAFYKNKLIAVMTFGQRKITGSKELPWELIRYATIANFNCIGVAGKLFKYFRLHQQFTSIISYADRRWSEGNLYYQLGFQLDHISSPNYWYVSKSNYLRRYHRYNFRKNILKDKLEKFDPNLSEWENMKNNGYDRIWDCGNLVFKYN